MFEYLNGKLIEKNSAYAVIDVNGVGYRLFVPLNAADKMPFCGESVCLYTAFVVRELSQALYGFCTKQERDLFELLLTLSGIGPKLALAVTGHLEPSVLEEAVSRGNAAILAKVPGIGKKTAERLILDLKDKLKLGALPSSNYSSQSQDAIHALLNLGLSPLNAQQAVKKALEKDPPPNDLSSLITSALSLIKK